MFALVPPGHLATIVPIRLNKLAQVYRVAQACGPCRPGLWALHLTGSQGWGGWATPASGRCTTSVMESILYAQCHAWPWWKAAPTCNVMIRKQFRHFMAYILWALFLTLCLYGNFLTQISLVESGEHFPQFVPCCGYFPHLATWRGSFLHFVPWCGVYFSLCVMMWCIFLTVCHAGESFLHCLLYWGIFCSLFAIMESIFFTGCHNG